MLICLTRESAQRVCVSGHCTGGRASLGDLLLQTAAVGPVPFHLPSVGLVDIVFKTDFVPPCLMALVWTLAAQVSSLHHGWGGAVTGGLRGS